MSEYDGTRIAEFVAQLESREDLPVLEPGRDWDSKVTREIQGVSHRDLFGDRTVVDELFAECVRSGLLLWNDALDASHVVSQSIDTATGSYWHGIMHRREPDYGNSKYWFRNVGIHEAMPSLHGAALTIADESAEGSDSLNGIKQALARGDTWDPFRFVDWCESAAAGAMSDDALDVLRRIQLAEIRGLLEYSFVSATGGQAIM